MLDPHPSIPGEAYSPAAFVGEIVPFRVTAFREGHDLIGVTLRLRDPGGAESLHRLAPRGDGLDHWSTEVALLAQGAWTFRFEAYADVFATWRHAAEVKIAAGVDSALMRESGALLFHRAGAESDRPAAERRMLRERAA
ncbi:MAG: DUF3416 domain-containing protein, partial [Microbacterium sp.]